MALYTATCNGCASQAVIRCRCAPGDTHDDGCQAADFDAAVTCKDGSGCCGEDHHHGQTGNDCRPLTITILEV